MMQPKMIAFYLPQFYKNPDNDAWWGKGFTDWVSTKNAKPLFDGHYQPHIPLNENYYNLLDKNTMQWQSELMHEYGIDGLCIHHYWFKDGRRALEKPEQNLLEWTDIDIPFCFSWANETWARSWSKLKSANPWADTYEDGDKSGDGVLLQQNYGGPDDWEKHFRYLLPYFKDDRYIKLDGKPVFIFYTANQVDCLREMVDCWRKLTIREGLPGLYLIGNDFEGVEKDILDAFLYVEPTHARRNLMHRVFNDGLTRLSYTELWNEILSETSGAIKTYFGGFVGYDDSPRRGDKGKVIENSTPELFGGFLAELFAKNAACGNEFTFINAWNEWGEGMHLEPDTRYGTLFLQKISEARKNYEKLMPFYTQLKRTATADKNEKHELYLNDFDIWITNREKGATIGKWLSDKGYHNIAVYGYGIMGRHLLSELQNEDAVEVKYIVDSRKQYVDKCFQAYTPDEELPSIDVMIITSYYYWTDIVEALPHGINKISLRDIIYEINRSQII